MTKDEFIKIMDGDAGRWEGDNAIQGLLIINKYLPNEGVDAAEHDIIYSSDIDVLLNAGITIQDAIKLRGLNWMIDDEFDCMACFV